MRNMKVKQLKNTSKQFMVTIDDGTLFGDKFWGSISFDNLASRFGEYEVLEMKDREDGLVDIHIKYE